MLVNFWYVYKTTWVFIRIVFCLFFSPKKSSGLLYNNLDSL